MTYFDVFNGDADGICSLIQLRLSQPRESQLVTGVKRDIKLLRQVQAQSGDEVTVLDISLDKNRDALDDVLQTGAKVDYFDHHFAGDIPDHPNLEAHINTDSSIGTSFLVDQALDGKQRAWAVVGTFGDNFDPTAEKLAEALGLSADDLAQLRELGRLINYNGYGESVDDLHFAPTDLYQRAVQYSDPLDFIRNDPAFQALKEGYDADAANAASLKPEVESDCCALYVLPAQAWARRISGVYANDLATAAPERAHALLTRNSADTGYVVSVRAPINRPEGADSLCREFPTGGGRKAAAGINLLTDTDFDAFRKAFEKTFSDR